MLVVRWQRPLTTWTRRQQQPSSSSSYDDFATVKSVNKTQVQLDQRNSISPNLQRSHITTDDFLIKYVGLFGSVVTELSVTSI